MSKARPASIKEQKTGSTLDLEFGAWSLPKILNSTAPKRLSPESLNTSKHPRKTKYGLGISGFIGPKGLGWIGFREGLGLDPYRAIDP